MIPDIGLMIGCYIITRMVALSNDVESTITVKVLSVVTILATAFALVDIFVNSSGISSSVKF